MKFRILSSFILFFLAQPAFASLFEYMDLEQLSQKSDTIVVGQVVYQYSSWDPDLKIVFTYTKVKINDSIKSSNGEDLTELMVRQPGGTYGNFRTKYHGVSTFRKGERAFLFIRNTKDGAPTVTSPLGKYVIRHDKKTQKDYAEFTPPKNAEFVQRASTNKYQYVNPASTRRKFELTELVEKVRSYSQRKGSK